MDRGLDELAAIIAAHLREWDTSPAYVELAIFGSDDAAAIAQAIDGLCRRELGAAVAGGLFHQSSIGAVTGVRLVDGRSVVIKAHQPQRSREFLAEIVRIQSYLSDRRVFATKVLSGPALLGSGFAIVEEFNDIGVTADAHDPPIRRALARGLYRIIAACDPLVATTSLGSPLPVSAETELWPTPHSRLFDFAATARGAEWIDGLARHARAQMRPDGRRVIGHGDWRQEHVRFVGHAPVVAFDWDSLCCEFEPAVIGSAMHGFRADWSRSGRRQAPTQDEARAFRTEYEEARGAGFSAEERRLCAAAFCYACAYTARCAHAAGGDQREVAGTFQHLLSTEGEKLLDL